MSTNTTVTDGLPRTDTRGHVVVAIVSALIPVTYVIVGLRFYARYWIAHNLGADDWMALVSLIIATLASIMMCLMTRTGLGQHRDTLSDDELVQYYKLFYVDIAFYIAALGFIKLAILLQYLRIFAVEMRKVTIWVTVVVCLWSVGSWLGCIFICNPISGFWDPSVKAVCIPKLPQWYANAAGNIITDIVVFALPIRILWKLQIPRSQRLSLVGVFALGFFTCSISVVRIGFLSQSTDDTYDNVSASGWSVGELCCGIIASCLPTLRPLIFKVRRGGTDTSRQKDGQTALTGVNGATSSGGGGGATYLPGSGTYSTAARANKLTSRNNNQMTTRGSSTEKLTELDEIIELQAALGRDMRVETAASENSSLRDEEEQPPFPIQQNGKKVATRIQASSPGLGAGGSGIRVKTDITQKSHFAPR